MKEMKTIKSALVALAAMATLAAFAGSKSTPLVYSDGELEPGDSLTFEIDEDDFPESIGGHEVIADCIPYAISVEWTGKKFKTPKSASPKVKKIDGEYAIVISEKGEDNPCSLKVKYKKKTGIVSGSFYVYTSYEGKKGKPKIKKYSASFSGRLGEAGVKVKIKKAGTYQAYIQ